MDGVSSPVVGNYPAGGENYQIEDSSHALLVEVQQLLDHSEPWTAPHMVVLMNRVRILEDHQVSSLNIYGRLFYAIIGCEPWDVLSDQTCRLLDRLFVALQHASLGTEELKQFEDDIRAIGALLWSENRAIEERVGPVRFNREEAVQQHREIAEQLVNGSIHSDPGMFLRIIGIDDDSRTNRDLDQEIELLDEEINSMKELTQAEDLNDSAIQALHRFAQIGFPVAKYRLAEALLRFVDEGNELSKDDQNSLKEDARRWALEASSEGIEEAAQLFGWPHCSLRGR